jgi:hypothetical protein
LFVKAVGLVLDYRQDILHPSFLPWSVAFRLLWGR